MGGTSHFPTPLSSAYAAVPTRKNTKSCDCLGCHHPPNGDDPSDAKDETVPELHTWAADRRYSLPEQQAHIGPAFLVKSDSRGIRPHLDPPEFDTAFMSYPQIYVCPRSAAHISFPIIDYSTSRMKSGTPWPHFYMAIAPKSATVTDLKTALTPKGSDTLLTARFLDGGNTTDMSSFSDMIDLRCKIIQLEIMDIPEREKPERKSEKGKSKENIKSDPFGFPTFFGVRTSGSKHKDGWRKK